MIWGGFCFLQRRYQDAVQQLQAVLAIDPEDLQAQLQSHALLQRIGRSKEAHEHEVRYMRF